MIKINDLLSIDGKNVSVRQNTRGLKPYWTSFSDKSTRLPYTLAANTTIPSPLTVQGPRNNPDYAANQCEYMVYADATDGDNSAFTIQLKDFCGRELMNRPCHIRTVAGSAQQPALLYEPLFIKARETMWVQLQKLTAGEASIFWYLPGVLYTPQNAIPNQKEIEEYVQKRTEYRKYVYTYWQTTEQDVVLSANAVRQQFDIMMGETFEAFNITSVSTGAFNFRLTDVRSGQELMNGAINNLNGIGNAQNPMIFDEPYLIMQGSRLRFSFDNLTADNNTIYITMQGRRINAKISNDFKDLYEKPMYLLNNVRDTVRPQIVGAM